MEDNDNMARESQRGKSITFRLSTFELWVWRSLACLVGGIFLADLRGLSTLTQANPAELSVVMIKAMSFPSMVASMALVRCVIALLEIQTLLEARRKVENERAANS